MFFSSSKFFAIVAATVVGAGLFSAVPQAAQADSFSLSHDSRGFHPRIFQSDTTARNFDYVLDFNLVNSTLEVTFDRDAGTARVFGYRSGDILGSDRATVLGTASGFLDLTFEGLRFDEIAGGQDVYAVGYAGEASSAGDFNIWLDFDNVKGIQDLNLDVYGGFVDLDTAGRNAQNRYGFLGNDFNFVFTERDGILALDAWVKSTDNFTLPGLGEFALHGDIHGQTEVPEPSTLLLLGAGAVGLAFRKRQLSDS